jgi:hypothetical protein
MAHQFWNMVSEISLRYYENVFIKHILKSYISEQLRLDTTCYNLVIRWPSKTAETCSLVTFWD